MPRSSTLVGCALVVLVVAIVGIAWSIGRPEPMLASPSAPAADRGPGIPAQVRAGRDPSTPSVLLVAPSEREDAVLQARPAAEVPPMAFFVAPQVRSGHTIRVLQDAQPAAGAIVHLFRGFSASDPRWLEVAHGRGTPDVTVYTDAGGVAFVPGDWPNGALLWCLFGGAQAFEQLEKPRDGEWHRLDLGSATVTGVVYDAHARPVLGAHVRAHGNTQTGPNTWRDREHFVAVTDANGEFVLRGLPRERLEVSCDVHDGTPREMRTVDTTAARVARVRFGEVLGARRWSGRIVDVDGQPLPGHCVIRCRDPYRGEERQVWSDRDGAFGVTLPVGSWACAADVGSLGELREPLEERIDIVTDDVVRDLRMAGKHVVCTVRSDEPIASWTIEMGLVLERDGEKAWNRPPNGGSDTWTMVWRGLPPGTCRLRSQGIRQQLVGAPASGLELDLSGPAATTRIEVVLR